jgi:hypothetical protein
MKNRVAQDAGIVDHAIKPAEAVDGHLDDPAGRNGFRDGFEIGHSRAAAPADFLDHLFGGRGAGTRAVGGDAGIVDDDLGAFGRAKQCDLAADSAPCAGDDDGFAFK